MRRRANAFEANFLGKTPDFIEGRSCPRLAVPVRAGWGRHDDLSAWLLAEVGGADRVVALLREPQARAEAAWNHVNIHGDRNPKGPPADNARQFAEATAGCMARTLAGRGHFGAPCLAVEFEHLRSQPHNRTVPRAARNVDDDVYAEARRLFAAALDRPSAHDVRRAAADDAQGRGSYGSYGASLGGGTPRGDVDDLRLLGSNGDYYASCHGNSSGSYCAYDYGSYGISSALGQAGMRVFTMLHAELDDESNIEVLRATAKQMLRSGKLLYKKHVKRSKREENARRRMKQSGLSPKDATAHEIKTLVAFMDDAVDSKDVSEAAKKSLGRGKKQRMEKLFSLARRLYAGRLKLNYSAFTAMRKELGEHGTKEKRVTGQTVIPSASSAAPTDLDAYVAQKGLMCAGEGEMWHADHGKIMPSTFDIYGYQAAATRPPTPALAAAAQTRTRRSP
ncbi:hypothetical protein JL720_13915 [Aureococcus anophagefferens]|nr:hypothetical protein JL720_13915 [Aureococcus anophagefferens]